MPRVEEVTDEIRDLVKLMHKKMVEWHGQGLAAPQVGKLLRLFVVCMGDYNELGQYVLGPLQVFINPKLSEPSEEEWVYDEGCLSVPKILVPVYRPETVHVEWTDENGEQHSQRFEGHLARCIMHENDHLNGVLHVDRASKRYRKEMEGRLKSLKKKYYIPVKQARLKKK